MKDPRQSIDRFVSVWLCFSLLVGVLAPACSAKGKGPWDEHIEAERNAMQSGDYDGAERYLQQAMEDTRKFKDGDVRLGSTYFEMGELNVRLEKYTLAKEYYERALNVQQKVLGAETLEAANSLYGIALCCQQLGDHLAAEIYLKRVDEIWRKKLSAKDPKLVSILPSMAAYAAMKNDLSTAESYYKQLVEVARDSGNQLQLGSYLNLLASTLGNEGKYDEAKDCATRAVEILKVASKSSLAIDGAEDNLGVIKRKLNGDKEASPTEIAAAEKQRAEAVQAELEQKRAAERDRIAAEKIKVAEQTRIAAEQQKVAEKAKLDAEKAKREAEEARLIAEKARAVQHAEDLAKAKAEEALRIAEKAKTAEQTKSENKKTEIANVANEAEKAKAAEQAKTAKSAKIAQAEAEAETKAEISKQAEAKRLAEAAKQAKLEEQAKLAAEQQAKIESEQKMAMEAARIAEQSRIAAAEDARKAKLAAQVDKQQAESEEAEANKEKNRLAEEIAKQPNRSHDKNRKPWETDRDVRIASSYHAARQSGGVHYTDGEGRSISGEQYKAMLLSNESIDAMRQQKYRLAVDILSKALDLAPDLVSAHTNMGVALNDIGKPDEAIEHLRIAIALDPRRAAPWANLASSFQLSGQLKNCVDTYAEFLHRFPNDPAANFAKALSKNLQKEVDAQDEVSRTSSASAVALTANDYFPYSTVNGTIKWDSSHLPLKIYIASGSGVQGYKSEYHGVMADAFKTWSNASEHKVNFEFVDGIDKSDIDCIWTTDYSLVSSIAEGGEAQTQFSSEGIHHVKIVILTCDPSPETSITESQIQAVCLHEIGHSLGLIGHSPKPGDIMYCSMPSPEAKIALSPRDVGTIRHLYNPDVQIAMKDSSSSSASLDPNDKLAVNNEGVNLMSSHAYAKAIEKFESAVALDPNFDLAKENLGNAYNKYALDLINKGKDQEAESMMQKAMKLQASLRSTALRLKLATMRNYAYCLRKLHRDSEADKIETEAKALDPKEEASR